MPISICCPRCNKAYQVRNELAGKRAKCGCGQQMTVPELPSFTDWMDEELSPGGDPLSAENVPVGLGTLAPLPKKRRSKSTSNPLIAISIVVGGIVGLVLIGLLGYSLINGDRSPLGSGLPISVGSEAENVGCGDYVAFREVGIQLRQPEGFGVADSWTGFVQPITKSSVLITNIPGPFAACTAGFTEQQMEKRGWTFLGKQTINVDGMSGILVHFQQPAAGIVFRKWVVAFGDEKGTTIVTAMFPKSRERVLSDRMKSAVLSVRPATSSPSDRGDDFDFSVESSQELKRAQTIGKTLVYTKDGNLPAKSPKDPLFVVGPSLGQVAVSDRLQYAENRLYQTAHTERISVSSTRYITIDGLKGYEFLAEAIDADSGTPLALYHVMLFDEDSYVLMQGLVGASLRAKYLPEFKSMAHSFRRKR